jgi:hypothetical protein
LILLFAFMLVYNTPCGARAMARVPLIEETDHPELADAIVKIKARRAAAGSSTYEAGFGASLES